MAEKVILGRSNKKRKINYTMEKNDKIKGGKADKLSIEDIARKHNVFVGTIKKEIEMGIKVEKEHTHDDETAKEIAMDHLTEFPDYYTRLGKMEDQAKKKTETKESMGADASGSYEAPFTTNKNQTVILKKDIHNWKTTKKEVKEMDAGVSAGAMYDGPIGTAGPSSPMDKTKKKRKDPLKIDNAESKMGGASITGASTKDMVATKKGFPKFGGPDAKFVEINDKCKTYPYCDQGASSDKGFKGRPNPIKLKEAINDASKKYGIPVSEIEKMVINELSQTNESLPRSWFDDPANEKALRGWTEKERPRKYKITTKTPIDIVIEDDLELARLKLIFFKHDVKFDETEIK